jgi:hypothetical protein
MSAAGGIVRKHGNHDGRSTGEDRPTQPQAVAQPRNAVCGTISPGWASRQRNSRRHSPRAQTPQAHQRENQGFPATEDTVVPHRQSSHKKTFGSSGPPAGLIDRWSSLRRGLPRGRPGGDADARGAGRLRGHTFQPETRCQSVRTTLAAEVYVWSPMPLVPGEHRLNLDATRTRGEVNQTAEQGCCFVQAGRRPQVRRLACQPCLNGSLGQRSPFRLNKNTPGSREGR